MTAVLDAWTSVLHAGSGIFPYLGVAVVCILVLACLALLLYLVYRLSKRLPPALKYLAWLLGRAHARLRGRLSRKTAPAGAATVRWGASGETRPLGAVFTRKAMAADAAKPLVVLFGLGPNAHGAIEEALGLRPYPDDGCHATWWSLPHIAVLHVHLDSFDRDFAPLERMAALLLKARPEPPVGLLVDLYLHQAERVDATALTSMGRLQQALMTFGLHSGHRLPLWLALTQPDTLRGAVEASRILGAEPLAALTRWEAASAESSLAPAHFQRTGESLRNALLATLARDEQAEELGARERARSLLLAQSWAQLSIWLPFLQAPDNVPPHAAAAFPPLRALDLLVTTRPSPKGDAEPDARPVFSPYAPWARGQHTRPPVNALRAQQHRRLAMQTATAALGVSLLTVAGVASTSRRIDQDARLLRDATALIAEELEAQQAADRPASQSSREARNRQVVDLLRSISHASQASAAYIAVPRSWFGGPVAQLQASQGELLRDLIVVPRVRTLSQAIDDVDDTAGGARAAVSVNALQDLPSFAAFRGFIERRRQAVAGLDTARELAEDASFQSVLNLLGRPSLGAALHGVDTNDALPSRVRERLRMAEVFDEIVDTDVQEIAPRLWERVLEEALDRHPLVVDAEAIESALMGIARGEHPSAAEMAELSQRLQRVRLGAQARSARRLLGKPADTASFFSTGLSRLVRDGSFSLSQMADATDAIQRHREQARRKLLSLSLPGETPFFAESVDGQMAPTADFARMASAWKAMSAQPFMALAATPPLHVPEYAGAWDLARLQSLKDLQRGLQEFLDGGLVAFDPSLRPSLRRWASQRTRAVTRTIVLESAFAASDTPGVPSSLDPLAGVKPQVLNLVAAAGAYRQTLTRDEPLDENDPVAALLHRSAQRLLARMKTALLADDPYGSIVQDVGSWMKRSNGALAMATTLGGSPKERLAMAREYTEGQYAAPASALLEVVQMAAPSVAARDPELQYWRRFVDTFDGFDKGATSNGLVEFEQYLLSLGKLGRPDDCGAFLAEWPVAVRRSDHFSVQLTALEKTVSAACAERGDEAHRQAYEAYALWFNGGVAQHRPFGQSDTTALTRPAVLAALVRYGELRAGIGAQRAWPPAVNEFLRDMDALHQTLVGRAPASTAASAADPRPRSGATPEGASVLNPVALQVRLRGQGDDSELVKHIIDVAVSIGGRTVNVRSASSALQWQPGETIEVRLRWAANSPYAPVGDAGSAYKVSGRTATFSFPGDWALYELLGRASAQRSLRETLVPLPVTVVGEAGRAEVDFQLRLMDADGAPLRFKFPQRAPLLKPAAPVRPGFPVQQVSAP